MSTIHCKPKKIQSVSNSRVSTDSEPPNPYLMGGSTRKATLSIDTLVLNLYFDHGDCSGLFKNLQIKKDYLQSTSTETETLFEFGRGSKYFNFNIQRNGVKFYPYILKAGDVTLLLSSRDSESSIPSARLQIGSISCQNGTREIFDTIKKWLHLYGLKLVRNSVSRVDVCHDFMVNLKDRRLKLYNDDYIVSKARKSSLHRENRKISGVQYGRGDIVLRIYDKLQELKGSHNLHKLHFFMEKWGKELEKRKENKSLSHVTRVEFQLRGDVLKEFFKHGTYNEMIKNIYKIWKYLTNDWFRHCSHEIDRDNRHQDKSRLSYFWQTVQKINNIKEKIIRTKRDIKYKSLKGLRDQMKGLFVTICAGMGHQPDDLFGMMCTANTLVKEEIESLYDNYEEFKRDFQIRQNKYQLTF